MFARQLRTSLRPLRGFSAISAVKSFLPLSARRNAAEFAEGI